MGRKKASVSTAELLARSKKGLDEAGSWEDASAMLAEEAAERDAKESEEKAAARLEKAETKAPPPQDSSDNSSAKGKKKKKSKADAGAPVAPQKSATDLKREEIQRKVEAAQKARAAETRRAFSKDTKEDAAFVDEIMGTRGQMAQERRQGRSTRVVAEEPKAILMEASPSAANQQHPDETTEEWHAIGRGGFERTRVGFHPGVSCDRTGKVPIVGDRYQLGQQHLDPRIHRFGYDVCEEVWLEMPPEEQATYERIPPEHFASDEEPLLQPLKRHFAYQTSGL